MLIEDLEVHAQVMSQADAHSMGAMALFGEKYGSEVRVVSVGDWAHELCGGTHAKRSGQLGLVTFVSEGSIGAGFDAWRRWWGPMLTGTWPMNTSW